jgi:hypothetical protein
MPWPNFTLEELGMKIQGEGQGVNEVGYIHSPSLVRMVQSERGGDEKQTEIFMMGFN